LSHRSAGDDSEILSRSAPPPSHPLQSDSEHSLSPKLSDNDMTLRDVQRTISLTSENPSEAFFSADEDIHASRSSSLKTTDGHLPLGGPKKRFASDLSIVGPLDASGRLSSHRSDYEIHTPEHRLPTRPQSTAELVSSNVNLNHSQIYLLNFYQEKFLIRIIFLYFLFVTKQIYILLYCYVMNMNYELELKLK
jgi:hypothetical protein